MTEVTIDCGAGFIGTQTRVCDDNGNWGVPDRSPQCAERRALNSAVWHNSQRMAALSRRGSLVGCPPPCDGAALVWEHVDWLLPHIETFLQLINATNRTAHP